MALLFGTLPLSLPSHLVKNQTLKFKKTNATLLGANATSSHRLAPPRMHIDYLQFQSPHDYNMVSSLTKEYMDESCVTKMDELKEDVRAMLGTLADPLEQMEIVDTLERLGIAYHFEEHIESMLSHQDWSGGARKDEGLYDVALRFRLMRQHGYYLSPDIFNKFKERDGRFKQELREDIRGLLCLFEASHLGLQGEDILDEARDFASEHLKVSIAHMEPTLARQVKHALEHPLHKGLARFEARHLIETWHIEDKIKLAMVELATLDFNFLQSMHQAELQDISRWVDLGLEKELKLGRVQPLKWFMWPIAMCPEPQFSISRVELAKVIGLIYIIDDIYDVYGSLDELLLFTEAINRWDHEAIEHLPRYMQKCLLALHNTTNEIGYKVMKEHGCNAIEHLRKSWKILSKAYLVEAKWFTSKYVPKVDEYLSNGVTSSGVHVVLLHLFFLIGHGLTEEAIDRINNNTRLVSCPGMILRLWDDFGTSMDEKHGGNDGSYINCHIEEHSGSSLETAQEHLMNLINSTWKKLNQECLEQNCFPLSFTKAVLNVTRMVQVMYQYDDEHRLLCLDDHIKSLLFQPIQLSQ